jgi:probable HAF family extracellular repeat protein
MEDRIPQKGEESLVRHRNCAFLSGKFRLLNTKGRAAERRFLSFFEPRREKGSEIENNQQRKRETIMKAKSTAVGLVACLAISVITMRAQQPAYRITDLGVVQGMTSAEPAAINNVGQIIGSSTAGTEGCAFLYFNGSMRNIGGINSRAFGISERGSVAGDFVRSEPGTTFNHAALFKGGEPVDLGVLPGALYSRANGVNSHDYVVGYSGSEFDSDNSQAFVWHRTTGMVALGTLGGPYAQAMAVNDAGYLTGNASIAQAIGVRHAFLTEVWPGYGPVKPMVDLGTLGGSSSYGMAINMSNHVVGYSLLSTGYNARHAFLYNGGQLVDLGSFSPNTLGADYSVALGINNSDQIVGYSYIQYGGRDMVRQAAFIIYPNMMQMRMLNLNDLIASPTPGEYWIFSATSINDRGQIVACAYHGNDGFVHAILLDPIVQ